MNLRAIRYFIELTETGSYTTAAKKLGVSQPSISHAIKELETELGLPLFNPSKRTELTDWGKDLLSTVKTSMSLLDEGTMRIKREAEGLGTIRLGFMRTLGMTTIPQIAAEFKSAHPENKLSFKSGRSGELLDLLSEGRIDIAFVSGSSESSKYIFNYLFSIPLVLVTPPDHTLAEREYVTLKDTLSYPFINYSEGAGLRKIIEEAYEKVGSRPSVAYEDEEVFVISGLVSAGFGIAIVPSMKTISTINIRMIPIHPSIVMPVYAAISKDRIASPASIKLLNFTLSKLKQ